MRHLLATLSRAFAFFGVIAAASSLSAQSTSVLNLANIDASQAADGLGFNIQAGQDWQWAAIAAAGGTHARMECAWSTVEKQTLPPANNHLSYVEDPNCSAGFASAARYGIHPTVIAAYGAPYHQILTLTVPGGAAVGSTSINVQLSSGVGGDTLADIAFPYDYICPLSPLGSGTPGRPRCAGQIAGKYAPEGVLITGVKLTDSQHATLSLASALNAALPADSTPYMVSEILYPSAASQDPNDPSIVAYANYVSFLAQDMANHGVTGDIEIWNEPPWKADSWDFRQGMYDSGLYTGPSVSGANFGFIANLQHRTLPPGITITWNGTSGSGNTSLLGPQMAQYTGQTLVQPSTTVTKESFHPYGGNYGNPEGALMSPTCLEAAAASTDWWGKNIYSNGRNCFLPGEPTSANLMQAVEWDDVAKLINPKYGVGHSVTETNIAPPVAGLQIVQARAIVRQFLSYEAVGITPVEFFEMYNGYFGQDPSYSFVDYDGSSFTPRPGYTALAGLMADIRSISQPAVTQYSAATLPSVSSYSGTYPLVTMNMVGARDNANANSSAFVLWQLTSCKQGSSCWFSINVGAGGPVTVNIPTGMSVTSVRNVTTTADVSYTTNGQQISFSVGDDPIEVLTDPTSADIPATSKPLLQPTKTALSGNPGTSSFGSQVLFTAVVTPSSTKTKTTDGQTITFYDGATAIATAPLSSGVATFSTTALKVGPHTMHASYTGDTNFGGSSGSLSFNVTPATSTLVIQPVADQMYGTSKVNVTATSTSPGAMNLTVVSGPARVYSHTATGATIALLGAGVVVVRADQQATTGYEATSAQTSFTVQPATPTISFLPIPTVTYGSGTIYVTAGSASRGAFTFSVVSGPATISGNAITIKGAGNVVVQASQAATTNYTSATATTSFNVLQKAVPLSFRSVPTQIYGGAAVALSATSVSPSPVVYRVISGPGTVSGNLVSITGTGTIVVQASQAASADYTATSAQTSFAVQPANPTLSLASIATQNFGGSPIPLQTSSRSPGALSYKVTSGPAQVSGNTVVLTGIGWVNVVVSQAATSDYTAAATQVGFRVNPGTPTLALQPIADQSGITAPFSVSATSNSSGPISYRVLSGPAKVSQNVVTVTGFGTVTLQASQGSSANFLSATAQESFLVIPTSADVQ